MSSTKRAIFLMAPFGHDPTETAIPWQTLTTSQIPVSFATETGEAIQCDPRMLEGWTATILGANAAAKAAYAKLEASEEWKKPLSWASPGFDLGEWDVVVLPGGHDKGVRAVIESESVQRLLAGYFPLTRRGNKAGSGTSDNKEKKILAAICHGPLVLARARGSDGKSLLNGVTTTGLPHLMEQGIFWTTRPFLGDYYKTFGAGSQSVEEDLTASGAVWKGSMGGAPFVVEDDEYNYVSGRFPPDAEALAQRVVEMLQEEEGKGK